jgi:triphosphoribosyl-dephospho-CoA synthase
MLMQRADTPPRSDRHARPAAPETQRVHGWLGRAAIVSLYDELALYPKPGLVSFVDSGSHHDMDAGTFLRSLFSLRHYFAQTALAGSEHAPFARLEALGIEAETRMLAATRGVNTHRGAIFVLGLLSASAGAVHATGRACTPEALRNMLMSRWGDALRERIVRVSSSNGSAVAKRLGLRGASEEAALGFPTLFEHTLPALQRARLFTSDERGARLHAFFATLAVMDDTTLAHRGGLVGLRFGQSAAREFLEAGGVDRPDAIAHAVKLHHEFVRRRLSPGGVADMLAAACWLDRVCIRDDAAAAPRA